MLELLREGTAPAVIVLGKVDAILVLGVLVGQELGYPTVPVIEVDLEKLGPIRNGAVVSVDESGAIDLESG